MKQILTASIIIAITSATAVANDLRRLQDAVMQELGVSTGSNNTVEEWQSDLETSFAAVADARRAHVAGQVEMAKALNLVDQVDGILGPIGLSSNSAIPTPENEEELNLSIDISKQLNVLLIENLPSNFTIGYGTQRNHFQQSQRHFQEAIESLWPISSEILAAIEELPSVIQSLRSPGDIRQMRSILQDGRVLADAVRYDMETIPVSYAEMERIARRSEVSVAGFDSILSELGL